MSQELSLLFRFIAGICIGAGGFLLMSQYPQIDVERTALVHALGWVLMGVGAVVIARGTLGQSSD